jgi:hypothetical protein
MYWLIVLASAFNDGGDLHCVVALVGELLEEYYLLKVVLEAALSEQLVALKDQQLQRVTLDDWQLFEQAAVGREQLLDDGLQVYAL